MPPQGVGDHAQEGVGLSSTRTYQDNHCALDTQSPAEGPLLLLETVARVERERVGGC